MGNYITKADLEKRLDNNTLKKLTHEPSEVDPDNPDIFESSIADAEALINRKIGSRYSTPLENPTSDIIRLACDIAVYYLWQIRPNLNMPDTVKFIYEQAIKELDKIETGRSNLLGLTDGDDSPIITKVSVSANERRFSREILNGR